MIFDLLCVTLCFFTVDLSLSMFVPRVVVFLSQLWGLTFLGDGPILNKPDLREIIRVLRKVADALDNDYGGVYNDGGWVRGDPHTDRGQPRDLRDDPSPLWRPRPTLAPLYYQTESDFGSAGNRIFVDDFANGDDYLMS